MQEKRIAAPVLVGGCSEQPSWWQRAARGKLVAAAAASLQGNTGSIGTAYHLLRLSPLHNVLMVASFQAFCLNPTQVKN